MNIFILLKNTKNLSHNEQTVAKFILDHPDQFLEMNTKQISQKCFVSTATIYRMCEKLNLSGLSELKLKVSSSINNYFKENNEFDFDFPIKQNQTHYEMIEKIKEDYEQTLLSTSQLFPLDQLRHAINAMKRAKVIDIYTSAGNIFFAQNFQFQMQEIGVQVNVPIEDYQQRLTAASSDSSHLAILISFAGRGMLANVIPQILKENKTPILLISSLEYVPDHISIDYHLYMSSLENHYHKISSFSTRLSILYILDVLYTCYFEMDYDHNMTKKMNYYHKIGEVDDLKK